MSQFEGPQNPNFEKPIWNELETDPKFQENFMVYLKLLVLEKKFGAEFYENYQILSMRKALENDKGEVVMPKVLDNETLRKGFANVFENPLIPEVAALENKLQKIKTAEGLLAFAKKEGVEITSEEIEQSKKHTITFMAEED